MNKRSVVASVLAMVVSQIAAIGIAKAGIPLLNYSCPTGLEVHADEGGYVYINGEEATLRKFNDNYYEARLRGITISITINPDGSASVSYTRRNGASGVCSAETY